MTWKDILKAPFDAKRSEAAKKELYATRPKEDFSTDISTFASKYIDPQLTDSMGDTTGYGRAFATSGFSRGISNEAWKPMTKLVEKYGIDKLEEELGKLYNTKVFISHRDVGTDLEDYIIDVGRDYEGKSKR
tara:strand:+ start:156 stop:551 length:396 start_codon:yes stop_codon:yes gene_type:complete